MDDRLVRRGLHVGAAGSWLRLLVSKLFGGAAPDGVAIVFLRLRSGDTIGGEHGGTIVEEDDDDRDARRIGIFRLG